ncbi:MAG: hypothetical protein RLO52_30490 [Sandaracinaceae bacterium]
MTKRGWLGVGAAMVALVLYDALVITDEERLEAFVEDVTGRLEPARVAAATDRWVDLERQSLELSALGESRRFDAGDEAELAERRQRALSRFMGDSLRALSTAIEVEDREARVTLRLLGTRTGMATAEWTLHKAGDDWLVQRLRVTR